MPARRGQLALGPVCRALGHSSSVRTTTSSTCASVIVRGTPGRGSSVSPSSRSRRKRARHLVTVLRLTPAAPATARLCRPARRPARSAPAAQALRRAAALKPSSLKCAARLDNTSGSSWICHTQADPISQPEAQNPELGHRTTHVVTIELMTGSLGRLLTARREPRHQTDARLDAEPWRPHPAGSAPACGGCEQAKARAALDSLAAPVGAELRIEVVHVGL